MKINSRPINRAGNRRNQGFTLIEMIGVLAVIAILAAVLIPKVFQAINDSRVNNAAMSCNTVKTAIADHYAKAGALMVDASGTTPVVLTTLPIEEFDKVPLIKEAFLDKPFLTKIGDGINGLANNRVRAFNLSVLTNGVSVVDGNADSGFALAGRGTNDISGAVCIEAVITGVVESDAKDLND